MTNWCEENKSIKENLMAPMKTQQGMLIYTGQTREWNDTWWVSHKYIKLLVYSYKYRFKAVLEHSHNIMCKNVCCWYIGIT